MFLFICFPPASILTELRLWKIFNNNFALTDFQNKVESFLCARQKFFVSAVEIGA